MTPIEVNDRQLYELFQLNRRFQVSKDLIQKISDKCKELAGKDGECVIELAEDAKVIVYDSLTVERIRYEHGELTISGTNCDSNKKWGKTDEELHQFDVELLNRIFVQIENL